MSTQSNAMSESVQAQRVASGIIPASRVFLLGGAAGIVGEPVDLSRAAVGGGGGFIGVLAERDGWRVATASTSWSGSNAGSGGDAL